MKTYELVNPSDPYTFKAPNIQVAGTVAFLLSTNFGAKCIDEGCDELTPVMFGWDEWTKANGIDEKWVAGHKSEIADALDSFLLGDAAHRKDAEEMLAELPPEKRAAWRDKRQERRRTSLNRIGEQAYVLAKRLRGEKDEPELVTFDDAVAMLPEGDKIHTFRQTGMAMLGADWSRDKLLSEMRTRQLEKTGPIATGMGHGLCFHDERGPLFIATEAQSPAT